MNIEEIKPGDILIKKEKWIENRITGYPIIQILSKGKYENFHIKELGNDGNNFCGNVVLSRYYRLPTEKDLKLIKLMMIK